MALVGGGSAGNVAGGTNPAGTGSNLNYIGDRVYAISGEITVNSNTVTQLDFTTGPEYIMATYQFGFDSTNMSGSDRLGYIVQFNGTKIYEMIPLLKPDYAIMSIDPLNLVIPPFTRVTIESITTEGADVGTWGVIAGRYYL